MILAKNEDTYMVVIGVCINNERRRTRHVGERRFAGLSRAAFARIPQMTVILARHASAVCSMRYNVRNQPQPIVLACCVVNKLVVILLVRNLRQPSKREK